MFQMMRSGRPARFLEVHDAVSAQIADRAIVGSNQFDGLWSSSFIDSLRLGRPDMEVSDVTQRLQALQPVLDVTKRPVFYDGDTGGLDHQFHYMVRALERAGIAGVAIEDKLGTKRNSMIGANGHQVLADPKNFIRKLRAGLDARTGEEFRIIARTESLVVGAGEADALRRSLSYIEAGAHGIMIQSASPDPQEIISFVTKFRRSDDHSPVVVVPTAYGIVTEERLADAGVTMIVYANHLMRAAHAAMSRAAHDILLHRSSSAIDEYATSVHDLLQLFPEPPSCSLKD